jgi:hypothetical protein
VRSCTILPIQTAIVNTSGESNCVETGNHEKRRSVARRSTNGPRPREANPLAGIPNPAIRAANNTRHKHPINCRDLRGRQDGALTLRLPGSARAAGVPNPVIWGFCRRQGLNAILHWLLLFTGGSTSNGYSKSIFLSAAVTLLRLSVSSRSVPILKERASQMCSAHPQRI